MLLGEYVAAHRATVRCAAKEFGISKSTVHKDLTERLPKISPQLFKSVKEVLEENKRERHIRGGIATKHKYEQQFKKGCKMKKGRSEPSFFMLSEFFLLPPF